MPYTMEDFTKDFLREHLHLLPPEERLKGLPLEERLTGLSEEDLKRLKGYLKQDENTNSHSTHLKK